MNVLLGVTGGIAAYKSAELVRQFIKSTREVDVRVVMTEGACEFIRPMTLQVLSENPVGTTLFDPQYESEIGHIDLARWADVMLVAPATANAMARMAQGMGDDLLTTVLLATEAPVVVAPAMNTRMWYHPGVQQNVETLRESFGWTVVSPDSGELACKEIGPGRMPDPPELLEVALRAGGESILAGEQVVVTAGPTREHLDPVRLLTNPSSGKMGYAIARAAARSGADVTLVSGPTALETPTGVERVDVQTARQMYEAVMSRAESADFICKAAAVCDWRPKQASDQKVKKEQMAATIELERNPDILAGLGETYGPGRSESGPILIGFAAETDEVLEKGKAKLKRKGAHMLVANKVGGEASTFGADEAVAYLLTGGTSTRYGPVSKVELGRRIWKRAVEVRREYRRG